MSGSYPVSRPHNSNLPYNEDMECAVGVSAYYPEERRRGKEGKVHSFDEDDSIPEGEGETEWRNKGPDVRGVLDCIPSQKDMPLASPHNHTFDSAATDPRRNSVSRPRSSSMIRRASSDFGSGSARDPGETR